MVVDIVASISWTGGFAYVAGQAIKYAGPTALDWALAYSLIKESKQTKPPPKGKKHKR